MNIIKFRCQKFKKDLITEPDSNTTVSLEEVSDSHNQDIGFYLWYN